MTRLIPVHDFKAAPPAGDGANGARSNCEQLEEGNILFFAKTPFSFPESDRAFLLSQRQSGAAYHKNIAYRPQEGRLTGLVKSGKRDEAVLRAIMKSYSQRVTEFLSELLPAYAGAMRADFASFRPQEEHGRQLRVNARNDLLHFDSFPTRPTNGDRIMRVFTNFNPTEPRVWLTTDTFDTLAERFAGTNAPAGLFLRQTNGASAIRRSILQAARAVGIPVRPASPYDDFMHRFHNFLKHNAEFQETCPKARWEFPPNSSWIAFTDMVSHAVLSGQFALEQTYIVSRSALTQPHKAPVNVLERLCGRSLTGH
ncbi:MAG TPA: Kdo hydroxylase family protein [Terriglobia bacterium]|nr:Kdo hydroxylase family protein [Terriglobia bacterium]